MESVDHELDFLVDLLENEGDDVAKDSVPNSSQLATDKSVNQATNFLNDRTNETVGDVPKSEKIKSLIHTGDTDSSDDDDNKNAYEQTYSEYGKSIKLLMNENVSSLASLYNRSSKNSTGKIRASSWNNMSRLDHSNSSDPEKTVPKNADVFSSKSNLSQKQDLYAEPISGVRVVTPLVTSTFLKEKLIGRQTVPMSNIKKHIETGQLSDDWVTVGVIVSSSPIRSSQKGNKYIIWTLSDLKGDLKTVSLFLFSNAHKAFWKTAAGVVVGVLNPSVMDKREGNKDEACLSIDSAQKVLIIGKSKDLGICKSRKANGDQCKAFVNKNSCDHCIYHAQKEYRKCSQRSELQSAGSSARNDLRNKVLGKNEVFYGGQSFMAIPAKPSKKMNLKDNKRLQQLSGTMSCVNPIVAQTSGVQHVAAPRLFQQRLLAAKKKEALLFSKLAPPPTAQKTSKLSGLLTNEKSSLKCTDLSKKSTLPLARKTDCLEDKSSPKFSICLKKFDKLDFNLYSSDMKARKNELVRMRAAKKIKELALTTPSKKRKQEISSDKIEAIKRKVEADNEKNPNIKKAKKDSANLTTGGQEFKARFEQLMAANSRHTDLIEAANQEAQDKYFENLELKEKLEEKMLSTYKVDCKAVKCLKCKYTAFSRSELCKKEGHPIRVVDAVKRFFKCHDCSNRTVCLELIPLVSCKNCGGSHWERAPMMREKKTNMQTLSICGNNEKQGGYNADANLNLLVPE